MEQVLKYGLQIGTFNILYENNNYKYLSYKRSNNFGRWKKSHNLFTKITYPGVKLWPSTVIMCPELTH